MLFGRSQERELLQGLIASARKETAGVLLLRGDAGIGKTSLLAFAVEAADDCRVLHIQGHESEMEIPFAGLSWLLQPLTGLLPKLPRVQAEALAAALQLGPASGGGDRLAVAAATLTLLAEVADEQPLLVAVDDAHWIDVPSLEAIVFAARRLCAERIAMVITSRPAADVTAEVNRLLEALPEHVVSGLDVASARDLLAAQHVALSAEMLTQKVSESAGNPLALLELPERSEHALPVEPLRIGGRLERTFGRRIAAVPKPTRQAMLLVAAAGASAADVLGPALSLQGLSGADLEPAETLGLLDSDSGGLRFHHPLVRSALYQSASAAERRNAHRVLADVFASLSTPLAQERHAWHLAAACNGPDEEAAAALQAAGQAAAERRSYATAMDMLEHSARLCTPGDRRASRLLEAAAMSLPGGRVDAGLPLLDRLLHETTDTRLRVEAQHLRCRIEMWRGRPVAARDLLLAEAERVEQTDPVWSAIMRSHAAVTCAMLADQRTAYAAARSAVELLADLPESITMPALVVRALTLAIAGEVQAARSLLERSEEHLAQWDPLASDQILLVASLAWTSIEQPAEALRCLERAIRAAREASAFGLLPFQLSRLAFEQWHGGQWTAAYSNALDAVALAEETGWQTEVPNSLVVLAGIEAGMGRGANCREHAARAVTLARKSGVAVIEAHAATALALLELGGGDALAAVRHLEFVGSFAAEHGLADPVLLNWAGDLVEALERAGQLDRARGACEVAAAEAARTGRPTQSAIAARCRGLLAQTEQEADEAFAEALSWHASAAQPFQEARTRLQYGELLRRRRRRADARAELSAALDGFERLGADPWADRARNELRATGITAKSRSEPSKPELTPQELRVALVVSDGATNAEAAAQLFLSAKTVEYHLSSVYRKLGIRSRAQLIRTMAGGPAPADSSAAEPAAR
jgi:DNA-binding CsgD family transcriptional regulator